MNRLVHHGLASLLLLASGPALAVTPTWLTAPGTGDWNTGSNWTGGSAPNGPADTATFDVSSITGISISANTQVSTITFTAAASRYTITAGPTFTLTLDGTGIAISSAATQNFVAAVNGAGGFGDWVCDVAFRPEEIHDILTA